jgi:hypothetical protein
VDVSGCVIAGFGVHLSRVCSVLRCCILAGSSGIVRLADWFHVVWVVGSSYDVIRCGWVLVRDSGACVLVVEVEWLVSYYVWWGGGCNLVYMLLLLMCFSMLGLVGPIVCGS